MEASPADQRLLTALTTEHFGLQGSRESTVGESSARSSLYLGVLSSTLIGLGFFVNIGGPSSDSFRVCWQLYSTNAMSIAVVNAVVGGGVFALAVGIATGLPLWVSSAAGGAFAIAYLVRAMHWERSYNQTSADRLEVLFPSPDAGG